jgi:hypothetical protein
MEFSRRLSAVAKLLFKPPASRFTAYLKQLDVDADKKWMAVVEITTDEYGRLKGAGVDSSRELAFLKGVVELGEAYVFRAQNLNTSSGLAGGVFLRSAVRRAKNELLERDAFLFHYRKVHPFLSVSSFNASPDRNLLLFEMASADPSVHCFLATDNRCAVGEAACLLIGLGAHEEKSVARSKAINEYSVMYDDHVKRPGWCDYLEQHPEKVSLKTDFHHVQSRDPRNKEIFRKLCQIQERPASIREMRSTALNSWSLKQLFSPIRFIKYVQADNPYITKLAFGQPEGDSEEHLKPLYHPIW